MRFMVIVKATKDSENGDAHNIQLLPNLAVDEMNAICTPAEKIVCVPIFAGGRR
jgi:hypothetical protein